MVDVGLTLLIERGFSRREIAERMQTAEPGLHIISSAEQPVANTPTLSIPELNTEVGIENLNKEIERYGIEALWVQKSAKYDLGRLACTVHAAATPEVVALVDDKIKFADWLKGDPHHAEAQEVLGSEEVLEAYNNWRSSGKEVCVKPVVGVNGQGYWRLTDTPSASMINEPEQREIRPSVYAVALAAEEQAGALERLIMMEWLPGPEVSVDLLCWRGLALAHASRTKLPDGSQRIQSGHEVADHAHYIAETLQMHGIVSMQYRLDAKGNWKMLEINPRPAGGSINSEDAGFGLITDWAKLVAGSIEPQDVAQRTGDVTLSFKRVATSQ